MGLGADEVPDHPILVRVFGHSQALCKPKESHERRKEGRCERRYSSIQFAISQRSIREFCITDADRCARGKRRAWLLIVL